MEEFAVTRTRLGHGGRLLDTSQPPAGATTPLIDFNRAKVHANGDKHLCVRSFVAEDLPGYEGEKLIFNRGRTWVISDHPAVRAYPENFAADGSSEALRVRGYKPTAAERVNRHRNRKVDQPARPPHVEMRSTSRTPPWRLEPTRATPSAPQIRRPRAVTGDEIYNLRTVEWSLVDPAPAARECRDRAMRCVERARFPHARADQDAIRGHLVEVIDSFDPHDFRFTKHLLQTGSPEFRAVFSKFMANGMITDDEKRTLSLSEIATGKATVPFYLDPTIVPTSSRAINPLRAIARSEVTLTDEWKGVGSEGIEAGYRSEGSEASDDSPTLSELKVDTESADAWIPMSFELDQDWGSKEPSLAALLQRAKDDLEAEKFPFGTGEDEPFGLFTLLTKATEAAEKSKLALGDIEAVEDDLLDGFLDQATWLGHRQIYKRVQHLDAGGGAPIWVKQPGQLPELNGVTAMQLSTMADDLTAENKILVVGDFQHFVIVDRIGMQLRRVPVVFKEGLPTGETGFYALWRNGTTIDTEDAFRVLVAKK